MNLPPPAAGEEKRNRGRELAARKRSKLLRAWLVANKGRPPRAEPWGPAPWEFRMIENELEELEAYVQKAPS